MRSSGLAVLCVVLASCRFHFDTGGESVFEPLVLPAGGMAGAIAISPTQPTTLYANVGGRVFESTDRGASWRDCERDGATFTVAVDPVDPELVYAGDESGLHRSTDGCATWSTIGAARDVTAIASHGTDLLVGGDRLYRLHQGSLSPLLTTAFPITSIASTPSGVILVATNGNSIVRSVDDGASFAPSSTGLGPWVTDVELVDSTSAQVVLAGTDIGMFRSIDGGATWTASPGGGNTRGPIAVDPSDPTFVVAPTWYGIISSSDGGASFGPTNFRASNMDNAMTLDLAYDPQMPGRIYAATSRGIFVASDHQLGWSEQSVGLDGWSIDDLASVPGQGVIFAASNAGVLRSSDIGSTWTVQATGMDGGMSYLHSIDLTAGGAMLLATGQSWVWRSTNAGATFGAATTVYNLDRFETTVVRSGFSQVWAGTATRLLESSDAGMTWTPVPIGIVDRRVNDIVLASASELWVATDSGVHFSADAGASFQVQPIVTTMDQDVERLVELPDKTLLAGTHDGVYSTTGPAAGWTRRGLAGKRVVDILLVGEHWIAATNMGVFSSSDAGARWSELPGLANRRPRQLLVDDASRLIVGTDGFGLYRSICLEASSCSTP